jgi:hypothetical protein
MRLIQPFVNVFILAIIGIVLLLVGLDVQGQEIPRDEYLRYLSLKSPEIVRQTEANAELHLFGNTEDPAYQDTNPVDGIDDRRHKVLLALAVEFAPYLVLNSTMIPMDFRLFMERDEAFLLSVDRWDVSKYPPKLVGVETIDWHLLPPPTSEAGYQGARADREDRRLRFLLDEFDPFAPGEAYRSGAISPKGTEHQVMFFNFPGNSEETWKQEYKNQVSEALPQAYERFAKVFVHPFVKSVRGNNTENRAYEFVLQYWFFYPYNDGFNNHEGDWEHINVFIKPLEQLHEPLNEADVLRILTEGVPSNTAPDRLVIQKVDYYFHHKVFTLDYTRPDVYQSRKDWEAELETAKEERLGEKRIWERLRYRAYWDEDETLINTHPIGFIGGDNVGLDQLMRHPGSSNQVSNGTYPFQGLYKNIGPAGATERISERFDHREYFTAVRHAHVVPKEGFRRGSTIIFALPDRIEIVPDGERVVKLVKENAQARRDWAWLVLPIRWGYPAAESPLAGVVLHTDLGNNSVLGPSYNAGWNRSGEIPGFQEYSPHTYKNQPRLAWRDNISNRLGYLNIPRALLPVLHPVDIGSRYIVQLFSSLAKQPQSDLIFQTEGPIPTRAASFSTNRGPVTVDRRPIAPFEGLMLNTKKTQELRARGAVGEQQWFFRFYDPYDVSIAFYPGERLVSEHFIRFGTSTVLYHLELPSSNKDFLLIGHLTGLEYLGSLRCNLTTGRLKLFLKGGYGWTRYWLKNVSINGDPLSKPKDPLNHVLRRKRSPKYLPNTLHVGAGIEWLLVKSFTLRDVGIRGEVLFYWESLDIRSDTSDITLSDISPDSPSAAPLNRTRPVFRLTWTFGF